MDLWCRMPDLEQLVHFIDEEIRSIKVRWLAQGHTTSSGANQDSVFLNLKSQLLSSYLTVLQEISLRGYRKIQTIEGLRRTFILPYPSSSVWMINHKHWLVEGLGPPCGCISSPSQLSVPLRFVSTKRICEWWSHLQRKAKYWALTAHWGVSKENSPVLTVCRTQPRTSKLFPVYKWKSAMDSKSWFHFPPGIDKVSPRKSSLYDW